MTKQTTEQQFVVDSTGTIVGYPPVLGAWSGGGAFVSTPGFPRPSTASEDVLSENVDEVTTVAGLRGDTSLTVTNAVAVVRGRLYLVISTTGSRFTVRAAATETAAVVRLADPLPTDVAVGSALKAFALTFALTAPMSSAIGIGSIEWVDVIVDGESLSWAQPIRIVQRLAAYDLTAADLVRLSPYAARNQPPDDADFSEIIDAVWEMEIVPQLIEKGIRPERIVSWQTLNPWHVAEVEKRLADLFETDDATRVFKRENALVKARMALGSTAFWYDAGDSLTTPAEDPGAIDPWSVSLVTR